MMRTTKRRAQRAECCTRDNGDGSDRQIARHAEHAQTEEEQHAIMTEFMFYKGISMAAAKELGSVIG